MLLSIHMLFFGYLSFCVHTVFCYPPAQSVSACDCVMTDLQAHASCKHKQLATVEKPSVALAVDGHVQSI